MEVFETQQCWLFQSFAQIAEMYRGSRRNLYETYTLYSLMSLPVIHASQRIILYRFAKPLFALGSLQCNLPYTTVGLGKKLLG